MSFCSKITFINQGANAGYLEILDESGNTLYNDTLLDKTVYLEFGAETTIGEVACRNLTVSTTTTDSFYFAQYPFKYSSEGPGGPQMYVSINFGKLQSGKTFTFDKIEGGTHSSSIGKANKFCMDFVSTIGTDDMRNGKVNNTVFDIDKKKIYLKLKQVAGTDYTLELGYKKEA